jgi:hypothetical protein
MNGRRHHVLASCLLLAWPAIATDFAIRRALPYDAGGAGLLERAAPDSLGRGTRAPGSDVMAE